MKKEYCYTVRGGFVHGRGSHRWKTEENGQQSPG